MPSLKADGCALAYQHPELKVSDCFVFFNAHRKILHVSPQFCSLIGYAQSELLGLAFEKLLPPDVEFNMGLWRDFLETGHLSTILLLQTKRGQVLGLRVKSRRFKDGCMASAVKPIVEEKSQQ